MADKPEYVPVTWGPGNAYFDALAKVWAGRGYDKVNIEVRNDSWRLDGEGNWHFFIDGEEVPDADGSKAELADWVFPPWTRGDPA